MNARRNFTRIFIILAAVVTALILVRALLNFTTGKKLEATLARAKAEGVALKMRELVPDCRDVDNGAALWKAAESLLQVEPKDQAALGKSIENLFNGAPVEEQDAKILAGLVDQNRKALELMAEAAAKPCFVYKDWSEPAYAVKFIGAVPMLRATRLLAVDAVFRAEAGDVAGGLERCRTGMRFHRNVLDDAPYLITSLVALADMKILLIAFNRIVSGREIDPAVLAGWIGELDPRAWRRRFARWGQGERTLAIEVLVDIINGAPEMMDEAALFGRLRNRVYYWLIRPLLKSELIWVNGHWAALQDIIPADYFRVREELSQMSLVAEHPPWYFKWAGILLPNVHSAVMKEATFEAMLLATRAGLACKIHRRRTGQYPANLEALVPEILPELPVDPFTGRPLVYAIDNGQLLIYSLGSNQKGDGGRGTYMFTKLVMEKDDDWAWREKINSPWD